MSKTGDIVTIKMTDDPNNSDFEYMAHRRGNTQKDMFYVGAYLGFVADNKLRSLSGKTPSNNYSYEGFETVTKANGAPTGNGTSGYDMWGWYQLIFMQCMYVLKYKNLNSQAVVGMGAVNNSAAIATGGTETKGMDWGETTGKQHMKLFGVEDFWGNMNQWIGGFWCDGNTKVWVATENFNLQGKDYNYLMTPSGYGLQYATKVVGTTHGGFLVGSTSNGSATTYYCDQMALKGSRPMTLMSYYSIGDAGGIFCEDVGSDPWGPRTWIDVRLMYV